MNLIGHRTLRGDTAARRLFALGDVERRMLLIALVVVAHVRVVLWLLPSRVTLKIVRRLEEIAANPRTAARPSVEAITWAIGAASRRIPRATCLTQAVSAQLLLRHYGYDSRLCLGVARPAGGEFFAHAWLERDGRIVIGGIESAGFIRMPALKTTIPRGSSVKSR